MGQKIFFLVLLFIGTYGAKAQELNAKVTINSDKVQGTSKQIFTTLQRTLTEFINNRKWTDATFARNERIECTFTFIISEYSIDNNQFKGEVQVLARRPVYNAAYMTTLINFRDKQLDFEYVENTPLEYTENTLDNNLTATVVFYIYTILGLDFDSFSPEGGNIYYQRAQQIVTMSQAQTSWVGWKAFDSDRNRHAMATAFNDQSIAEFREFWYTYHRKGLDEMAANPDRGRTTIIEALPVLQSVKSTRPSTVLLQIFSDAKLDELASIYSKATNDEKQAGYKLLLNLFPGETSRLESLKK